MCGVCYWLYTCVTYWSWVWVMIVQSCGGKQEHSHNGDCTPNLFMMAWLFIGHNYTYMNDVSYTICKQYIF